MLLCFLDCLECASCSYIEPAKDIGLSEEELGDSICKDGGASINSTTCREPAAGHKAVCVHGKGKLIFEFVVLGKSDGEDDEDDDDDDVMMMMM